jgi:predicted nuclease with RNAse H fold
MQNLTRRGVELAQRLRTLGIEVIESYPGAAQDIMSIPRKQKGLRHLTEGLIEFGITGEFALREVSHDELDAITSAVVGLFYLAGRYEALGNEDEDYLIVPSLLGDGSHGATFKPAETC